MYCTCTIHNMEVPTLLRCLCAAAMSRNSSAAWKSTLCVSACRQRQRDREIEQGESWCGTWCWLGGLLEYHVVVEQEGEEGRLQEPATADVQSIFPIQELHHRTIRISHLHTHTHTHTHTERETGSTTYSTSHTAATSTTHCEVIVDCDALQVFDEASLQVAAAAGLHCCVHQTLHACIDTHTLTHSHTHTNTFTHSHTHTRTHAH